MPDSGRLVGLVVSLLATGLLSGRARANEEFLSFYAERLPSVELNSTGYRLPSEEQFERWAAQVPDGFRFAVKMPPRALRSLGTFEERVRRLGDRLGPVRVVVESPRDDGLLALLLGSTESALALDLRDESWDGVEVAPAVRVNDWDADAPFRYLRFREPPYSEAELAGARGPDPAAPRRGDRRVRLLPARGRAGRARLRGTAARAASRREHGRPRGWRGAADSG